MGKHIWTVSRYCPCTLLERLIKIVKHFRKLKHGTSRIKSHALLL